MGSIDSMKLPSKYNDISQVSQDNILNGIEPQFTKNELLHRFPIGKSSINDPFEIDSFYDLNQYLTKLLILAHCVYPKFNKSIIEIFNIDETTHFGQIMIDNKMQNDIDDNKYNGEEKEENSEIIAKKCDGIVEFI